ncbi:MAG: TolC family protein [Proteobacteria bacterium]|nr:TolC family protein [Pseudomonadota bacterium]
MRRPGRQHRGPLRSAGASLSLWALVLLRAGPATPQVAAPTRVTAPAPPADAHALTLAEVLEVVARQHPLIEASVQKLRQAEGKLVQAEGGFDTELVAEGGWLPHADYEHGVASVTLSQPTPFWGARLFGRWRIGRGDFPVYKEGDATAEAGEARAGIELPLLRDGPIDARRAQLQQGRLRRDAARLGVSALRIELRRQAAHRYWDWVAAGLKLEVERQLLQIARQRDAALRSRVARGDLPAIEVLDNRRTILMREGSVVRARRKFEQSAIKLSLFLRDASARPVRPGLERLPAAAPPLPAPLEPRPIAEDLRTALGQRPDLQQLALALADNEVEGRLSANQRWPRLAAIVGLGVDVGDERYRDRRSELGLGFKLEWPLLMRKASGGLLRAEARQRELQARQRLLRDEVEAQIRDARSAIEAARQRAEAARDEREVAHQVEAAERERLEFGAGTLLTVNLRELAAAKADKRAIDAATTCRRALADYEAVLATVEATAGPGAR